MMARIDYTVIAVATTIFLVTEEGWNLPPAEPIAGKFLNVKGSSDFQFMVEQGFPVVDKTKLIKKVMESIWQTDLICRPRRFGKSVALSMFKYFLSIDVYRPKVDIFQNFSINDDDAFCKMHKNKYPVINLDLKSTTASSFGGFMTNFKKVVKHEFIKYQPILLASKRLHHTEKTHVKDVCTKHSREVEYEMAIPYLMEYLHKHYKKRVVVLVDEYDSPVIHGFMHGYYPELIYPFRNIMINIFKDNAHLQKGIILSITKVAKGSILSALSNIAVWSIIDTKYAKYFGFLEDEVHWLAGKFNLDSPVLLKKMTQHYDGYLIGNQTLFNPWSVMMCFAHGGEVRDYWKDSGDSEQFYEIMQSYGALPMLKSEILFQGRVIRQFFREDLAYTRIHENENFLWTYVTQAGYLTFRAVLGETVEGIDCVLRIPNNEVKAVFKGLTAPCRKKLNIPAFTEFVESIKNREVTLADDILTQYLNKSANFFEGQDKVKTATEIVKGLELEYGPIGKIVKREDYSLIIMKQPNSSRTTKFLIKTAQNKSDLNLDKGKMKDLFQQIGEGVVIKSNADYISHVLILLYQHLPHFRFF